MAQSAGSASSSRRQNREHDSTSMSSARFAETEWEAKESVRQRELEEARARAAQMEKTMRWWSDCTANWREKWSKVRNERNKARDEAKLLRSKLEDASKETNTVKREKQDLELQNDQLKRELEKIHLLLLKHAGQFDSQILEALESDLIGDLAHRTVSPNLSHLEFELVSNENELEGNASDSSLVPLGNRHRGGKSSLNDSHNPEEYVLQGAVPKHAVELYKESVDDGLLQKVNTLQSKLDEAKALLETEREEKASLKDTIATLTQELSELRSQSENLSSSKLSLERDVGMLKEQVRVLKSAVTEETGIKDALTRRQLHLRNELDRIYSEHDIEWWRRERCETQKNALERENGTLRAELEDLQRVLSEHEGKHNHVLPIEKELADVRKELLLKTKELTELKHGHLKLKSCYHDTLASLSQAQSRSDLHENEIKKLRSRIDELKQELFSAEREVDSATNNIRRLHRTNEELQSQVAMFQTQMDQLHTRLTHCDSPSLLSIRGPPDEPSDSEAEY